jgi:hypothetical protein
LNASISPSVLRSYWAFDVLNSLFKEVTSPVAFEYAQKASVDGGEVTILENGRSRLALCGQDVVR